MTPCQKHKPFVGRMNSPFFIWATSREKLSLGFGTRVDSNRPVQPQKLARLLKFRIKKLEVLYYLGSQQQRRWSDCADAQIDLPLCCSHME